ncbi:FtsB family cell division protein [Clostridium tetani]|uniref:FtsB family cell division protein n=2 Tax=Clostridium tetani TaxID=1513 RepID=UPI001FB072C0|nr:septum formation initiator family protein [Clostridium tetani]
MKGKISIMGVKVNKKKIICILLTFYVCYIFGKQQIIISNINTQIAEKTLEHEEVKIKNQKMLEEIDMTKTNDYIEKLAREKLGLVKPGENTVVDSKK